MIKKQKKSTKSRTKGGVESKKPPKSLTVDTPTKAKTRKSQKSSAVDAPEKIEAGKQATRKSYKKAPTKARAGESIARAGESIVHVQSGEESPKMAEKLRVDLIPRYVTQKRIAEIADVSEAAISKLAASVDFKRDTKGNIDLYDLIYNLMAKRITTESDEYQRQRLRKVKAEAAIAEHELAVAKREVVPMAEAVDFIEQKLAPIAVEIRSLPAKLGVLCVGLDDAREAESVIAKEVDKCLAKIRES